MLSKIKKEETNDQNGYKELKDSNESFSPENRQKQLQTIWSMSAA